jgi:hypothetical protein
VRPHGAQHLAEAAEKSPHNRKYEQQTNKVPIYSDVRAWSVPFPHAVMLITARCALWVLSLRTTIQREVRNVEASAVIAHPASDLGSLRSRT